MSIIIQTGHHSSYSSRLMEELYIRGLERPSRSLSYRLSANEITHMLVENLSKEDRSKLNYKIADNLIIDLQLGNVTEKAILGWEDEKNIVILDYLKDIELNGKFLLVYDHPKYMFQNINFNSLNTVSIDNMINEWLLYHKNLINFYEENKSICLLLEGKAVFTNFNNFKSKLSILEPNISLKSNWQIAEKRNNENIATDLDITIDLLSNLLFKGYPELVQVYNKMLDLAVLKNSQPIYKSKTPSKQELILSLKIFGSRNADNYDKLIEENKQLRQKLNEAHSLIEDKKKIIDRDIDSKKIINTEYNSNLKSINKKLVFQLTEAYEKIENYSEGRIQKKYLEVDRNTLLKKDSIQELSDNKPRVISKPAEKNSKKNINLYGAESRIKEDLPYRLGSIIVNCTRSRKEKLLLPLKLLNEYDQYKKNEIKNLPPLEEYADRVKGEKVKNQLSYKIGKRIVDISDSPTTLVKTPFGIIKDIYSFRKKNK